MAPLDVAALMGLRWVVTGASNVKSSVTVPTCEPTVSSMSCRVCEPTAVWWHMMVETEVQLVVVHVVISSEIVGVTFPGTKLRPLTVTERPVDSAALLGWMSDITGASYVNDAVNVPNTLPVAALRPTITPAWCR